MMTLEELDRNFFDHYVWTDTGPDLVATKALHDHLRRPGASIPARWFGAEVVTTEEARRRLATDSGDIYDPWNRTLLPPDAAALWANRDLLHAAHWGCSTGAPEWKASRWTEADDLLFDAQGNHPGIARLITAYQRQPESVKAAAVERATTAEVIRPVAAPIVPGGGRRHVHFTDFLISIQSTSEARRRARDLSTALSYALPGDPVKPNEFFMELADALRRYGLKNDFLNTLAQDTPNRRAEVLAWKDAR
jgi:hypothetical protein